MHILITMEDFNDLEQTVLAKIVESADLNEAVSITSPDLSAWAGPEVLAMISKFRIAGLITETKSGVYIPTESGRETSARLDAKMTNIEIFALLRQIALAVNRGGKSETDASPRHITLDDIKSNTNKFEYEWIVAHLDAMFTNDLFGINKGPGNMIIITP